MNNFLSDDDKLHILAVAAPAILGLLREREEQARFRIYGEFRRGNKDLVAVAAEWSAYVDLIRDIENKLSERDSQKGTN